MEVGISPNYNLKELVSINCKMCHSIVRVNLNKFFLNRLSSPEDNAEDIVSPEKSKKSLVSGSRPDKDKSSTKNRVNFQTVLIKFAV